MNTLYNEIDPYAAQWLRNLGDGGHITKGEVDERSIEELRGEDVAERERVHFFAGIGVWDYALRLAGVDGDAGRGGVAGGVWTGSCPCQPWSSASRGRRRGSRDRRHLWPEWRRLIEECKPSVVFGEQVATGTGPLWFDLVADDFESMGYAIGSAILCSSLFGLPRRPRIFFAAYADRNCQPLSPLDAEAPRLSEASELLGADAVDIRRVGEGSDGSAGRVARLRAYGNAICAPLAAVFVRAFMQSVEAIKR